MYIRTSDGIYEPKYQIEETVYCSYGSEDNEIGWVYEINEKDIISDADSIKELCDEFVFDDGDDVPLLCTYEELIYWFNYSKKQQFKTRNCYGAIWTDKGLIYAAKMNDEGVLKLICLQK